MTTERFRAGKRLWEPIEEQVLRDLYPHWSTVHVAAILRRSMASTYNRARNLGIAKSEAFMASPLAYRLRRGDNVGKRTRFGKGHVPANKGLRRPGYARGRMQETQFKKGMRSGQAAANYMPVGSTRLIDAYLYRKVSEIPNVPYTVNWKLEHHLIWVAAHGQVPPGYRLRFVNRDATDIRLDNLELVTPRAMMARNTVHNLPKELAHTVQVLGALTRQIRKRERHAEERHDH